MTKKIILNASFGRLEDKEPFLIAQNNSLDFAIDGYLSNTEYLISFKNGELEAQIVSYGTFTVPDEVLKGGMLEVVISVYSDGILAKQWNIEPLILIEHNEGFEAYTLIDDLIAQNASLQLKIEELENVCAKWQKVATDSETALATAQTAINAVQDIIKLLEAR